MPKFKHLAKQEVTSLIDADVLCLQISGVFRR